MRWNNQSAPSLDAFAELAEQAFAQLPPLFRNVCADVVIRVDDFPGEDTLGDLEIDDPFELTGLYVGLPVGERDAMGPAAGPSRVFLYRRPILDEWCQRGDVGLYELVSHVLIHELGHHIGLDDDQIHAIENRDDD